jgi:glucose/arabinose dehydrogenase
MEWRELRTRVKSDSMRNRPTSFILTLLCFFFAHHSDLAAAVPGTVVAWGYTGSIPKTLTNVVKVMGGDGFGIALHANGSVTAWGSSRLPGPVIDGLDIVARRNVNYILRTNGNILRWDTSNQQEFFSGTNRIRSIASGIAHALGLKEDGTVLRIAYSGVEPLALTNVMAVAAGSISEYSLALQSNGTIIAWNYLGPKEVPANLTNVVAIAVDDGSMALKADGTVICWPDGQPPRPVPPSVTNIIAISVQQTHSLALRADGKVLSWDSYTGAPLDVPSNVSNILAIAAGPDCSFAITRSPILLQSPLSQAGWVGSNVTVSAIIGSSDPLAYQWFLEGVPVPWATNNALNFTEVGYTNAGEYYLIASNAYGMMTSAVATLAVLAPNVVVTPSSSTRFTGDSLYLEASPAAMPPLFYQWYRNGAPLAAATNRVLSLTQLEPPQSGNYTVSISNKFGIGMSASSAVTVLPFDLVTPQDKVALIGTDLSLFMTPRGFGPFTYQWFFNETNQLTETARVLVFTNVQLFHEGIYKAIVSNPYGSITSRTFSVTLSPNISIQDAFAVKPSQGTTQLFAAITMAAPWPVPVSVGFHPSNGTATAPGDYVGNLGSVTFLPGVTTQFARITVNASSALQPKHFAVELNGASVFVSDFTRREATCWIVPSDIVPQITAVQAGADEDNVLHDSPFELTLSAPSPKPIRLNYATADQTALAGIDYIQTAGSLFIPPGTVTQFVRVPVVGNLRKEPNRTFLLNLSSPVNASLLTTQIVASILDDDGLVLPSAYTATEVAHGFALPTALEVAPDGRIFVCEQEGAIQIIKNGKKLPKPLMTLYTETEDRAEAGLTGIVLDPGFATNQYIYVYYTVPRPHLHNRVSRFALNGDAAILASEHVILELNELSFAFVHNGGGMQFGPDGKLYIGVGNNGDSGNSQTLTNLLGKLLRINPDGTIPEDNPFYNTAQGMNRAVWALGLRNPFSLSIQPITGRVFINDVGEKSWEEINEGISGGNYGWPFAEGPTSNPISISPIFGYTNRATIGQDCAITAGAFYNPPTNRLMEGDLGKYYFSDYCGGWIKSISTTGTPSANTFVSGIPNPVGLKVGPDGALYCLGRGKNAVFRSEQGFVYRFESPDQTPHIVFLMQEAANQYKARVRTTPGNTYILQISTNLLYWQDLVTNVAAGPITDFVDSSAGATSTRFYRIRY